MCHDESPASTEKRFRVNVSVATVGAELVDKLGSDSSALVRWLPVFSVLIPSTLLDASDDELFAAAALLAISITTLIFRQLFQTSCCHFGQALALCCR